MNHSVYYTFICCICIHGNESTFRLGRIFYLPQRYLKWKTSCSVELIVIFHLNTCNSSCTYLPLYYILWSLRLHHSLRYVWFDKYIYIHIYIYTQIYYTRNVILYNYIQIADDFGARLINLNLYYRYNTILFYLFYIRIASATTHII